MSRTVYLFALLALAIPASAEDILNEIEPPPMRLVSFSNIWQGSVAAPSFDARPNSFANCDGIFDPYLLES